MATRALRFPAPFKVFLRHAIGGRQYADRLHIFRKYWCSLLEIYARMGSPAGPGDDNKTDEGRMSMTNRAIEQFSRNGVDQIRFYELKDSIAVWRKRNRIQQRRNAAKASWTETARRKRKKQKSLGGATDPKK